MPSSARRFPPIAPEIEALISRQNAIRFAHVPINQELGNHLRRLSGIREVVEVLYRTLTLKLNLAKLSGASSTTPGGPPSDKQ